MLAPPSNRHLQDPSSIKPIVFQTFTRTYLQVMYTKTVAILDDFFFLVNKIILKRPKFTNVRGIPLKHKLARIKYQLNEANSIR